ncbi:MAG: molecular chaperone [Sphingopyxis sp.]|nr:molecular chaperone [Sphingopyxis sp.]
MNKAQTTRSGLIPILLLILAIVLLVAEARPAAAQAGSILIWPVDPVIEADARATALWLENPGKAPITLQVRIYAWSQDGGKNAYAPQETILGTPPIVTIAPGAKQLVRLTRTMPTPVGREQAFRVVVDEIPTASPASTGGAAVSFRMRYSLPLFVYGAGMAHSAAKAPAGTDHQLAWRIVGSGNERQLEIRNMGVIHARLTDVGFAGGAVPAGDDTPPGKGLFGYVLAGATMRWPLPAGTPAASALVAVVNGGPRARLERLPD